MEVIRGELFIITPFWLIRRILCHFCVVANFFIHSDGRSSFVWTKHVSSPMITKHSQILDVAKSFNMIMDVTSLNDSLSPIPNSNNIPPCCVSTPNLPQLSPPYYEHTPPSLPVFEPPVVFPPPTGPPPRSSGREWCVAKPSVPDPIIQEAMNYACGSGADCGAIEPNGPCYKPNSILAHASYAFNSYFQRTRVAGGTCDFGGTAILVTLDPGSEGCHFINY